MNQNGYQEGFHSLFDKHDSIRMTTYPSQTQLLQQLPYHWPIERLQWFSKGFYAVEEQDDGIFINDLRMGLEPSYAFRFKIAQKTQNGLQPVQDQLAQKPRDLSRLADLWNRIWQQSIPSL